MILKMIFVGLLIASAILLLIGFGYVACLWALDRWMGYDFAARLRDGWPFDRRWRRR